jgi:hypothetical protein
MTKQPWIGMPLVDALFILLLPFISLAVIAFAHHYFRCRATDYTLNSRWIYLED